MDRAEKDIVSRAVAGDAGAFETIYRGHSGLVFHVALGMIGDADEAADITQEVFLKVHEGLSGFSGRSSLKTWICAVAMNASRERLRRRGARIDAGGDFDAAMRHASAPGPRPGEAVVVERELEALLSGLPTEQRECLILREIEGMSYAGIAEALGINVNTVRTRLLRARRALLEATGGAGKRWTATG